MDWSHALQQHINSERKVTDVVAEISDRLVDDLRELKIRQHKYASLIDRAGRQYWLKPDVKVKEPTFVIPYIQGSNNNFYIAQRGYWYAISLPTISKLYKDAENEYRKRKDPRIGLKQHVISLIEADCFIDALGLLQELIDKSLDPCVETKEQII